MSNFARFAAAAVLVAGFAGIAQAQSNARHAPVHQSRYVALADGNRDAVETVAVGGTVPPSESGTVMGLRVPR